MEYKGTYISNSPNKILEKEETLFSDILYCLPGDPDEWIEMFKHAKTIGEDVQIDMDVKTDEFGNSIVHIKALSYRLETQEEVDARIELEKKKIDNAIEARRVFEEKRKAMEAIAEKDKQKALLDDAIRVCESMGYRVKPKKKKQDK